MLKHSSFIIIMAIFTFNSQAQDSIYDSHSKSFKIGFLEPTKTVSKNNFLLEGAFYTLHSQFRYNDEVYKSTFLNTPELRLRYGVSKNLEIFVNQSFYKYKYSHSSSHYNDFFNRVGAGFKVNLFEQKGMLPETSISLKGEYFDLWNGNKRAQAKVNVAWNYDLGSRVNLAGNLVFASSEDYSGMVGLGLKLSYQFNPRTAIFMDWYLGDAGYDFTVFNIGGVYQVSSRLMLNANIGTNDFLVSYPGESSFSFNARVGVSFLLNKPNKKWKRKK